MKTFRPGIRAKILGGAFLLLVPLAIALTFVVQFGSAQIRDTLREVRGIEAAGPLWEAIWAWQKASNTAPDLTPALDRFRTQVTGPDRDLTEQVDASAGATWQAPEALAQTASGTSRSDPAQFSALHKVLMNDVLFLADASGLVLDPDLDSLYLILGVYQTIPNLLQGTTELRSLHLQGTGTMSPQDRLVLYSRAWDLQTQATHLADQITRSTRSLAQGYGPVPGYVDQATAHAQEVSAAAAAVLADAEAGKVSDEGLSSLVQALEGMTTTGNSALVTMLGQRVAAFQTRLEVALGAALAGLAAGLAALLFVVGGIRRRTSSLVNILKSVAEGDLTAEVPRQYVNASDELGTLAKTIRLLQIDLGAQVGALGAVARELSDIGSTLGANSEESAAAIEQMSATSAQVSRFAEGQRDQTSGAGAVTSTMVDRILKSNDLTQGMATQFFLFSQSMEANRRRIRTTAGEAQAAGDLATGLSQTGDHGERSLDDLKKAISGVVKKTGEIGEWPSSSSTSPSGPTCCR
jgi:HAMP domain-containing protein